MDIKKLVDIDDSVLKAFVQQLREYLFEWAFKTIELCPDRETTKIAIVEFSTKAETRYLLRDLISDNFLGKGNAQDLLIFHLIPLRKDEDFLMIGPVCRMEQKIQEIEKGKK